jgi:ADP-heptose:LPS heptosyltransferase|tara:strand:- start:2491 stop:3240 length:750 start_codon:yes stop_codon:yes gene_type:complete
MSELSKGFVIVASRNINFYTYAINLIQSIKDYYPEALITLVTEERFFDGRETEDTDQIIICGGHYREKLWGMANTPYDITMYVDADMECEHEDIMTIWDEMKDYDMVFHELTKEREQFYAIREFKYNGGYEKYKLCGGVCLYRSGSPLVKEFMDDWYELYCKQYDNRWMPDGFDKEQWAKDLRHFDQTTLWWLVNKVDKYKDLKIGIFEDDIRWNYFTQYGYEGLKSKTGAPPILRHYSGCLQKDTPIV